MKTEDLQALPLFHGMERKNVSDLAEKAKVKNYAQGRTVFIEQDPPDAFYILLSGRVKLFKTSPDGREQTLFVFGPKEPFCLCAALEQEQFPVSAAALEDSRVLVLPAPALFALAKKEPSILKNMIKVLNKRLRDAMVLIESLALKEISQRVASFLLHSASVNCPTGDKNRFELCITQRELAKMLGTTPETLSRVLRKMSEQGVVDASGRVIRILDAKRLEELSHA